MNWENLFTHPSSQIMIIIKHIKAIVRIKWIHAYKSFNTMAPSKWQICALTNVTVAIIFVSELILGLILFSWNKFLVLTSVFFFPQIGVWGLHIIRSLPKLFSFTKFSQIIQDYDFSTRFSHFYDNLIIQYLKSTVKVNQVVNVLQ